MLIRLLMITFFPFEDDYSSDVYDPYEDFNRIMYEFYITVYKIYFPIYLSNIYKERPLCIFHD